MRHLLTLLFIFSLTSTFTPYAQERLTINNIEIINLGDGRQFAHKPNQQDSVINGKVRIITGYSTEYIDSEFKEGISTGKWEYFQDNKLVKVLNYIDGYKDGENIHYYPNGEIQSKAYFVKGVIDGTVFNYYPNGSIKSEKKWKNGIEDGIDRSYNENGKLWSEINYQNGKAEGKSIMNITGNNINYLQTAFYKNGLREGEFSEVYDNGTIKEKGSYLNGQKNGLWEYNKTDGTKKLTEGYKDGELIKKITYYPSGNIETERNYLKGKENGVIKKYTAEGAIKSEHNYVNGKQIGKQITYFTSSNGGNYIETYNNNDKGQKDGEYAEIFRDNKNVKSRGKYINGQKDGKWTYGYINGTIYKEETYSSGKLIDSKKPNSNTEY
ncbi:toxin-antitoxin system YwqK family antitoxin [Dysgonomonas sp. GY617]|uniref:toxin-antitoxin system YwqK family antitoxin n=1 Tax=Dysgonomonas sp. GY617 TaxID=2780420 RepID=UPI00188384CE|nr:toxin-antitoxin system YwqK family antitoxin [Dysgonomonas sp. GY617]MBF0576863.1 hypothetical protein [Dysgonomonas sp. GY617]